MSQFRSLTSARASPYCVTARHSCIFEKRFFRLFCEAGLGDCTAETRSARSKEFLIKKFSELCELRAFVVNTSHGKPGIT